MRNLILATAALVAAAAPASAQHCCGARHTARPVAMVAMPVSYAAPVSYAPTFALPAPAYVVAAAPVQITSLQFAPMVAAPVQHVALTAAPQPAAPKLGASAEDPCARCMAELEKLRRVVETHTDVLTRHEDRLRALEKKAGIVPGG